jgi:hypothetical protein
VSAGDGDAGAADAPAAPPAPAAPAAAAAAPRAPPNAKGFSGGGAGGVDAPLPEALAALRDDAAKLDLASPRFAEDAAPLVAGCGCYACAGISRWPAAARDALGAPRDGRALVAAGHARRYVHHLLRTQEMLGRVLLTVHNTHHYARFLAAVRDAVREGRLDAYAAWFRAENGGAPQSEGAE